MSLPAPFSIRIAPSPRKGPSRGSSSPTGDDGMSGEQAPEAKSLPIKFAVQSHATGFFIQATASGQVGRRWGKMRLGVTPCRIRGTTSYTRKAVAFMMKIGTRGAEMAAIFPGAGSDLAFDRGVGQLLFEFHAEARIVSGLTISNRG